MNQPSVRRRLAGLVVTFGAVAAIGATAHATPVLAAAAPMSVICDSYGTCYDDGYSDISTGEDWSSWGGYGSSSLWDPGVSGTGWDPTYSTYDYGTPAGGSGDSSVISNYSDPGL